MNVFLFVLYLAGIAVIFYLLAKICTHYFVESLELFARKLKMSEDIAGATLMALGGSAPEFLIVIISLLYPGNHANIGAGAIVGSAIFNILMVIGAAAVLHTAKLSWKPVVRDVTFYLIAILSLFLIFQDGAVHWHEALTLVSIYCIYLFALRTWQKFLPKKDKKIMLDDFSEDVEAHEKKRFFFVEKLLGKIFIDLDKKPKYYLFVFFECLFFIALLSWGLVTIAMKISNMLNIPEAFIALTIVAIGTSIPDLMAASFMAKRGRGGMAIADALGSNIFDILFGFGFPWLVYTLLTQRDLLVSTENLHGSVLLLSATVIMIFLLLLLRHFKIGRSVGVLLISCYGLYIIYTILQVLKIA
ncbi:MAG: calcium/sodium antiporter [Patescibacteria group bacterium]|jgi:K+-dependent Na+/Ca+ exchanger-like protein